MEVSITENTIENLEVDGIVIGVYEEQELGKTAERIKTQLQDYLELKDFEGKKKQKLVLYNLEGVSAKRTVLVGLGKLKESNHENVRVASSVGVRTLRSLGAKSVAVEDLASDPQSTAEGAILGLYKFDELKKQDEDDNKIEKIIFTGSDKGGFNRGLIIAEAQNIARRLAELPSNIATPTYFVEQTKKEFEGLTSVTITAYDENWAKDQNMGSFLSVTAGTDEPAKFLEINYNGGNPDQAPIVFIGKGITFDTGGISLKSTSGMKWMRGDCGGAAAVIGAVHAIARLELSLNVIGLTPLTENMPSSKATKPTDVVYASNGKSIEITNTDAEGRLILADALVYAENTHKPDTVIDVATLTGSIMTALGRHYIGVFTRSDDLWDELNNAGYQTYEKFWRMPLDKKYKKQIKSNLADVKNTGGRYGGAITAAMFLGEFIEMDRWAHLDIAGVAYLDSGGKYKPKGMTGMPTRALVKFAQNKLN